MSSKDGQPTSPSPRPPNTESGKPGEHNSTPRPPESITYLEYMSTFCSKDSIQAISGASSGLASGIVTCPLDVIKVKLQAQDGFRVRRLDPISIGQPLHYRGIIGSARVIWREEGLRGMYRGLGPITLGYIPTWMVYFTVYNRSKSYLCQKVDPEREWMSHLLSSVTAGACSTICTNPVWVIKTRLMSQVSAPNHNNARPPWQYKSTLDAALKMYRNEGILSFYSGIAPALLGLTHVAVQFPLYEGFKRYFTGAGMGKRKEGEKLRPLGVIMASCLSKICASSATYPHEVIRTRLQNQMATSPEEITFRSGLEQSVYSGRLPRAVVIHGVRGPKKTPWLRYRGIIHTFKTILREEGWYAFYAGMGTNMIRALPASATTLLVYEIMVETLVMLKEEGERKQELQKPLE